MKSQNKKRKHFLCKYRMLIHNMKYFHRTSNELKGLLNINKQSEIYKGKITI